MTRPAQAADRSQQAQPGMLRVQILADAFVYEGYVHLLQGALLVQDLLNNDQPFLNLTEVVILDRAAASTIHVPYVALNKGAITHVVPLAGEAPQDAQPPPPQSPGKGGLSRAAQVAASQPTVPAAGPKTLPAPPPARRAAVAPLAGGSTQPFQRPRSDDELDLDDDDLDLDDE